MTIGSINSFFSSALIIALIFADYIRKYNTDSFQRKLYLYILISVFFGMASDFFYIILSGRPGRTVTDLLYLTNTSYFVLQIGAYYFIVVFIDYLAYRSIPRSRIFIRIVLGILIVHLLLLLLNLKYHFYFYISGDNRFFRGEWYIVRLVVSYAVIPAALADLFYSKHLLRKSQITLIVFFSFLVGMGAAMDYIFASISLIWPCLSGALLYLYFFIIQLDLKIDSLTGLGNRYSFNEFISQLARENMKKSYHIVIIDMDGMKNINDTLGHPEGDKALRDIAAIMKGVIRHSDFIARYGGDEFVLAVRAEYDIEKLLDRIRRAIDLQNEKHTRPYKLKISYGCAMFTTNSGQSIEVFLRHVDSLMYQQKTERRKNAGMV
ncbi:MAG: GGDEF domain-containing protein [Treponema sp.]|jgi:diguanylate cyclase (GGDEF)-like protein|nr:GGDEF domain-containing protein [Treponema sp.]